MDYDLTKHVPMVISRLGTIGLVNGEIDEGIASFPTELPAPYAIVGHITFQNLEDLQRGMSAHGAEIMGDIPNFTNIQPVLQVSRISA